MCAGVVGSQNDCSANPQKYALCTATHFDGTPFDQILQFADRNSMLMTHMTSTIPFILKQLYAIGIQS